MGSTKAEEGRIDAWIESLRGSAELNILPQPPRLLIGSVDKVTPEAIRKSLEQGLKLIKAGSNIGGLPPAYLDRLRNINPQQFQEIRIKPLTDLNITRPPLSAPYDPNSRVTPPYPLKDEEALRKYLEQVWSTGPRPPLILTDKYDDRFKYKVQMGPARAAAQSLADRAQFFSLTPLANTPARGSSLTTPATKTDFAQQVAAFRASSSRNAETQPACGRDYAEVSFPDLALQDADPLLRTDGTFTVDPTGYGVPSALVPEAGEGIPTAAARLERNRRSMLETGVFMEQTSSQLALRRKNHSSSGRGVKVIVIDTAGWDKQNVLKDEFEHHPYSGSDEKAKGHGSVIGELISGSDRVPGLAPGADVSYVQVCTGQRCDAASVISALCAAVGQAKGDSPIIVNFSLNMPYRSTTLYRVITEFTEAGGILVVAHGNKDRCGSTASEGGFRDYCNAYPADWAGTVRPGAQRPPLLYGRAFKMPDGLYSAGGWKSFGEMGVAGFNREFKSGKAERPFDVPTNASRYVSGEFFLKDPDTEALMAYVGTSFAVPVFTALIANWLSPGVASVEDTTDLDKPVKRKPALSHYADQMSNQRLRWNYLENIRERLVFQKVK